MNGSIRLHLLPRESWMACLSCAMSGQHKEASYKWQISDTPSLDMSR
jgi:hypothetical protein